MAATKATTMTASTTFFAAAKPLPTPTLPFQSICASEHTASFSVSRTSTCSSATAAVSAATLQLQCEFDQQDSRRETTNHSGIYSPTSLSTHQHSGNMVPLETGD
ncbi:hypothetical protein B0O80DRAFT_495659 [Mortierella sp. GBAus27b]|nr:hypothetical protein B0O80DRAFT_495659 [Mortierella sp. GBAus27b]